MRRHVANKTSSALICPDVVLSEPACSPPLCSLCAAAVSVKSDARAAVMVPFGSYIWPSVSVTASSYFIFFIFYSELLYNLRIVVRPRGGEQRCTSSSHGFCWCHFPFISAKRRKIRLSDTLPLLLSVYIFNRSRPLIWELVRTLDNRRPAGVGSDSVIFILTFRCFLLAIGGAKTLQS